MKYEVLAPASRSMRELRIRTRPGRPVRVKFIVVNPAAQPFNCEITAGADVISPS